MQDIRDLEARVERQVLDARAKGATWVECSLALGVSPQAVQQRYGSKPGRSPGGGSS